MMRFDKSNWALVPGPLDTSKPMSSLDLRNQVEYAPEEIAKTLLEYPGTTLLHGADPTWWDWKARWENDSGIVELTVTLMGRSDKLWGGSEIQADCSPQELIAIWRHLSAAYPGVWLHDPDCCMHTEQSFLETLST
jgi:hypothetical protein